MVHCWVLAAQLREEIEKPPFVCAHYISAVIVPNESPVCGSFQQGTITGQVEHVGSVLLS
ncbi:unnamed protein product [Tetraodon nigroviridis]|uniref:Chromosome undetermined SCAF7662, whole genome shotgun sequence n=1 Tax=Tetraodon nigroviridis TaxID=99883 RepID=Q4T913_TETNG|nr:unnamed protein product [Tetraodon nigroviridis]